MKREKETIFKAVSIHNNNILTKVKYVRNYSNLYISRIK